MDDIFMGDGFIDFVAFGYHVEIVIVMDATESMKPIMNEVKDNVLKFCRKFAETMDEKGKKLSVMHIKVITFRDFAYDGDKALEESRFFNLPDENEDFHDYFEQIQAFGGGNGTSNALEALAVAMRSDWTTEKIPGVRRRHIILLYTNSETVPLKDARVPEGAKISRVDNPLYPENMPANLMELGDMWEGMSQELGGMPDMRSRRMMLFVPNSQPWNEVVWCQSCSWFSEAGIGITDDDIDMIIR